METKDTSNYKSLADKIAEAQDAPALDKLDALIDKIYNAGQLTANELQRLDEKIFRRQLTLEIL